MRTAMRRLAATLVASAILAAAAMSALAQETGRAEGEVRKVDAEAGKITIRHGPIAGELDMPAMTMVFQVKDRAMLDAVKPGEKVRFTISRKNGAMTIESIEPLD